LNGPDNIIARHAALLQSLDCVYVHDLRFKCKNGGVVELEVSASVLSDEGLPPVVLAIRRDVTERRRAEGAMVQRGEAQRVLALKEPRRPKTKRSNCRAKRSIPSRKCLRATPPRPSCRSSWCREPAISLPG
jgi:hypothetical protein